MKFHEYIPYGIVVTSRKVSITLHGFLARGVNSKTELAIVVLLVRDTLSRNDLAICEVS